MSNGRPPLAGWQIFISYPRAGRAHKVAVELEHGLSAAGAGVFRDESGIAAGDPDWELCLQQQLDNSHMLLYLHGEGTLRSIWQRSELDYAKEKGIPFLVLRTDQAVAHLGIRMSQAFDAVGDPSAWLPHLIEHLGRLLGTPPASKRLSKPVHMAEAERDYLQHGLCSKWSDAVARYVPLAGKHQPTAQPHARRKRLRHDAQLLLTLARDLGLHAGNEAQPQPFNDVLTLYQSLLAQRQRPRLVVLGEPGAGKSFSLERLFCALAESSLADAMAPVPLLLALGDWNKADTRLDTFIDQQLQPWGLHIHWRRMRDAGRVVLLLDGLNEVPVGQRSVKATAVFETVQDSRWAGVLLSCRERDFKQRPLKMPMDEVRLSPLDEGQILDFLLRWSALDGDDPMRQEAAELRFWALAAGPARASEAREVWRTWAAAGASWQQFWRCDDLRKDLPAVFEKTRRDQDLLWRQMRDDDRSLLRLARSPFWLELLAELPEVPDAKASVFALFLGHVHDLALGNDNKAGFGQVPTLPDWLQSLRHLALDLQRLGSGDDCGALPANDGARTRLPRTECPYLSDNQLEFSIAVQVLKESDGQVGFAHQLMQETLASQALVAMALEDPAWPVRLTPTWFWPDAGWWVRNGWEVVAELAGESLAGRPPDALRLVAWLASAQPEVAAQAWVAAGRPVLSRDLVEALQTKWAPRLTTEAHAIPEARLEARAALGRALGCFGLDQRQGVGLRPDGLPDIDWVRFADKQAFRYQGQPHQPLPAFELARYPVTHAQFQAFIDDGGYVADAPWWNGLDRRFDTPEDAAWTEPNAPRDKVSWFEAVAFCRWLSHRLSEPIRLPTEQEWERAAAGTEGRAYPWGDDWDANRVNAEDRLDRTCAVGLLPEGASLEGQVHDLAGQVWEWCLNEYEHPERVAVSGGEWRVLRGGSWDLTADDARASYRVSFHPGFRNVLIGFRLCRASPI